MEASKKTSKMAEKNAESLKLKKSLYYQKTKNPEKQADYQRWYYSDENPKIKHVKKLRKIRNKKYYKELKKNA